MPHESNAKAMVNSIIQKENLSIQYGVWNDRSKDRLYEDVTLPFVLDPKKDGYNDIDGEYPTKPKPNQPTVNDPIHPEASRG